MIPAPRLAITGHLNGIALRLGTEVVATFPTFSQAVAAYRAAAAVPVQVGALLARTV